MRLSTVLLFCAIILFGWRHYNVRQSTQSSPAYKRFLKAYPDIQSIEHDHVVWRDGTKMPLHTPQDETIAHHQLNNPTLADQIEQSVYVVGKPSEPPRSDPGRIRYEPFFRKMYGNSPQEVARNLERVIWMPHVFGDTTYVLRVTRVNNVHETIKVMSDELEQLVAQYPEYKKYLEKPGGTFNWRKIANTNRLSGHSFGMTIDLNVAYSHYWQWDLKKEKRPISEDAELSYHNSIPWEIISIFEKHGFIWGGKWYHYDTMHFEYRPELFIAQ